MESKVNELLKEILKDDLEGYMIDYKIGAIALETNKTEEEVENELRNQWYNWNKR